MGTVYHRYGNKLRPVTVVGHDVESSVGPSMVGTGYVVKVSIGMIDVAQCEWPTLDEAEASAKKVIDRYAAKLETGGITIVTVDVEDF